ncbi:MAG TPA: PilN domain-containing protein [Bryobacteraceae bacterium]|nr:PilN domain-containing protein [Bryobacteraceae bacterium]
MKTTDFKKWLAIGTGIGIEIGRENLMVTVVRSRPSGVRVLGELTIPRFHELPASDWGSTYTAFLKKLGVGHLSAGVLLPRDEVIVRQVMLPGVSDKDLASAIRFEIDSLNPYSEEDAVFDWARIGKTSAILVGITRRTVLERYSTRFAEAGVKVASFTFAAPSIYSAVRVFSDPPAQGFLLLEQAGEELEVYGESPARPIFSARVDGSSGRATTLAIAELRLDPETAPAALHDQLPQPLATPADYDLSRSALAYATAVAGAAPIRPLSVNLLPREQRQSTSRLRFVPAIALASLSLLLLGAVLAYPKYADRQYLALLRNEIHKLEPQARYALELDRKIATTRNRTQTLDAFRGRTKEDLEAMSELTKLFTPPTFLNSMQLSRDSVTVAGEAEQAAALLKVLDSSKQFRGSAFVIPIARGQGGDIFSIRGARQGVTP